MMRVLILGLGPIGVACARAVVAEQAMQLVGLIDVDAAKVGRTLAELSEPYNPTPDETEVNLRVVPTLAEALIADPADLAIVTTTSHFDRLAPTLRELLARKIAVVTSCEEMAWPWLRHAELARDINVQAQAAGCAILGTGVNPGFVMDALPVVLASVVRRVSAVRCVRRVDAGLRRLPLQQKVGATMTPEQFQAKAACGKLGHQGIAESVALLAAGLGHHVMLDQVTVHLEPVIADRPIPSGLGLIDPGRVTGMRNTAHWTDGELTIDLDLTMAVGLGDTRDTVEIDGPVPLKFTVNGGLPGDSATVAMLLNTGRLLPTMPPGLKTMLDLPPAGCRGTDA